ncbi:MAG TPA: hypothetical protein VGH97_17520 [Thermoanaerobaculia bacterium]|jgi:hypothetical protein
MITILVLGPPHAGPEHAAGAADHPSVEILAANRAEEALEKLARNRRIDAVLLLPGSEAAPLAATLAEEDPSAPPLFAAESMGAIPGVRGLPEGSFAACVEEIVRRLETDA